ncbi:hypothetical protein AURDEDRAFT_126808 [Auricularia subglabra TFB-10046 SS5]|nr:hypothetical protein AURDEDRAFT_126808 [Auricularia subglabra TFB-10046 SS5]
MLSSLLAVASLGLFAAAQQTVQVGAGGSFAFSPTTITAQPGETITFDILSSIHTVTQSQSLADPCTKAGFGTNFGDTSFSITVNDTKPILVHCEAHCTSGMVMIINPAGQNDFTTMSNAAQGISSPSSPSSSSDSGSGGVSSSSPTVGSSSHGGSSLGPASSSTPAAGSGPPAGSNPPEQTNGGNAAPAGAAPSLLGGLAALFLASVL